MAKYEVVFTHTIKREVTCIVEADSRDEAKRKARAGEYHESNEDDAPEEGIEIEIESCLEVEE